MLTSTNYIKALWIHLQTVRMYLTIKTTVAMHAITTQRK